MGLTENQKQEITRFIQTNGWDATFDEGDILEDLLGESDSDLSYKIRAYQNALRDLQDYLEE